MRDERSRITSHVAHHKVNLSRDKHLIGSCHTKTQAWTSQSSATGYFPALP